MASPLLYKDRLYILPQWGNILVCYDAKTGKEITKLRLDGGKGFTSSPWVQNGKLCCLDETGVGFVLETDPELKVVTKNALKDMFWSTPAVAADALYLRGADELYCVKQ